MAEASLEQLLVIDRLVVGPVVLEPKRFKAPYRVLREGKWEENELIYKYEEEVFDPTNPLDLNLASMIAAQVALNYGLFCLEIEIHGPLDREDTKLLTAMMENTSREIYVNKILAPNEFLVDAVRGLPPLKLGRYTQASLHFPGKLASNQPPAWVSWEGQVNKIGILSSGGKDSLLTYGLLKELGKEVFPLFVNESGRHWFTALNAYRKMDREEPGTRRIWTNSDRIFNWMLRQLPLVKPNFASIRSDMYPVRLWTVAVFLFGVLPLARKHGLGRIVIGDEYDTTQRSRFEGIPHYNGLYDQSRFFDETLSRYFLKKGWDISQFSLLRPLSELLIMKVLCKRYPEWQATQVSCHAAHEVEGHIRPCGKCEKCRRIVGMMTALGEDPGRCGYSPEQVTYCLDQLNFKGVKQLGPDARHLRFMLNEKGHLQAEKQKPEPVPVVMKLRFDQERSPLTAVPTDLRGPLLSIVSEYADGAVLRQDRRWMEFQPEEHPDMQKAYAFESDHHLLQQREPLEKSSFYWAELTWPEAEERLKVVDTAILPVGAIEQHGPHLPLDVDAFDAQYLAMRVAEACSEPKPLVLPLLPFGVSYHHDNFPGTISLSNDTMAAVIYDVGVSLARNGIKKLIILNGHGDNAPALTYAAQKINRDTRIFTCVDTGETSDVDIDKLADTPNDIHAGEVETSTTLAVRPHLVKMHLAEPAILDFPSRYLNFSNERGLPWYVHTEKITRSGVMGDPTKATAEKGERIWNLMISHLVALVEDLKSMSLEELYQRKY